MQAGSSAAELFLKYPDGLGTHPNVTYEMAVNMLSQAVQVAAQKPFVWGHIDRPADGSVFLIYQLPQQIVFPNDGIRYQEQESRYQISVAGRELEVHEIKFGFVPDGTDQAAYRTRRRFRLLKGGHPQLMLIHYIRGQQMPIIPSLQGQPVRSYPLRPVHEPAMYVLGDKLGQKEFQRQPHPGHPAHPHPGHHGGAPGMAPSTSMGRMPGMVAGMTAQGHQAMLAQQSREMEALDRRQQRGRASGLASVRMEDEDSGDEHEHISTRSLALARYKRNHEFMNEVFMHAALGDKKFAEQKSPYASFDKNDLQQKINKMALEVDDLKAKAAERAEARRRRNADTADGNGLGNDVSMENITSSTREGIIV